MAGVRNERARRVALALVLASAGVGITSTADPADAAGSVFFVTNDEVPTGPDTWRQAVEDASASPGDDVIVFDPDLFILPEAAATYTGTGTLTIQGNGGFIGGVQAHQILVAPDASLVEIDGLAMVGGKGAGGGAVHVPSGDVTITNSRLDDNENTSGTGGAVHAGGTLEIVNSSFARNSTSGGFSAKGGAVFGNGSIAINQSTFAENTVGPASNDANGGAVYGAGAVDISFSSFRRNLATAPVTFGGAVHANGVRLSVVNTTVSDNEAGGGLFEVSGGLSLTSGDLTLSHATVVGNKSSLSANVYADGTGNRNSEASVIGRPVEAPNCLISTAAMTSDGYNHDDDGTCGFGAGADDVSDGPDPLLGPVRDNGGPPSLFPLAGSPLIDAIPTIDCPLDSDQRNLARPFGGGCDVGAVEAVFAPHGFSDVSPFYEAAVRWVTSPVNTPRIQLGFDDGTYRRSDPITRGQAAYLLFNEAGAPPGPWDPNGFSDVIPFFDPAVDWAKQNGVFLGFNDNTFRPNDPISRGQLTRAKWGLAGQPAVGAPSGFPDVIPFFDPAVDWAKANGLVNGFPNGTFGTDRDIIRGDAARIDYLLAQSPDAWDDPGSAPSNMLFRPNIGVG